MSITQKLLEWWRRVTMQPTEQEALALLLHRMRESEKEMKPEPSVKPRPIAYNPGDFAEENMQLIEIADGLKQQEWLWRQEAADSLHPSRYAEALQLADRWQDIRLLTQRFYSRWNIEP